MNQGLVIDNLCHRFHTENGQTVEALDHLSLEVPTGQIVSVIGASGCGKSTLLSLIAGFVRHRERSRWMACRSWESPAPTTVWSFSRLHCLNG